MRIRKQAKRTGGRHGECVFVGAWLPLPLVDALDRAATALDSDRSKIIRDALKTKVQKELAL